MDINSGSRDDEGQDSPKDVHDSSASSSSDTHGQDPVFYDENQKRWPWIVRAALVLFGIFGISVILFITSLFALRFMPSPHLPRPQLILDMGNPEPMLTDRQRK